VITLINGISYPALLPKFGLQPGACCTARVIRGLWISAYVGNIAGAIISAAARPAS
jgi:hypothetical protein